MSPALAQLYRTRTGRIVTFEELLREPKFLACKAKPVAFAEKFRTRDEESVKVEGPGDDPNALNPKYDYSCLQLGGKWNWSRDTIFRLFVDYPGVIKVHHPETRKRRSYTSLRIPGNVAMRWRREHMNRG